MKNQRTLLFVDTLTKKAGITVSHNGKLQQARFKELREYSRDLIKVFEGALKKARVSKDTLEGVVVLSGPGSYTSIRIGVSFANALGYALQIPVAAVTLFDALNLSQSSHRVDRGAMLIVEAGRGNVFYKSGKKEGIWIMEEARKKKNVLGFEIEGLESLALDVASILESAKLPKIFKPVSAHYVSKPNIWKAKKR